LDSFYYKLTLTLFKEDFHQNIISVFFAKGTEFFYYYYFNSTRVEAEKANLEDFKIFALSWSSPEAEVASPSSPETDLTASMHFPNFRNVSVFNEAKVWKDSAGNESERVKGHFFIWRILNRNFPDFSFAADDNPSS